MKTALKVVAAACMAAAAISAQAQTLGNFYAGGSLGPTRLDVDDVPGLDKTDWGGKVFAGATFNPNFGVELGWARLGEAEVTGAGGVRSRGFFVDAIGQFPVANNLSVLGRIGAYYGKTKGTGVFGGDESKTNIKWGIGAAYSFNPRTDVRLEWERYRVELVGEKENVDMLSVGVVFKF